MKAAYAGDTASEPCVFDPSWMVHSLSATDWADQPGTLHLLNPFESNSRTLFRKMVA